MPDVPIQDSGVNAVRMPVPPVRVSVPAAEIDVSVAPVGVLADGEMELPEDTKVAGWYKFGPDPSSATGSTILASHVDSRKYGLGSFSRLKDVAVGTAVSVTTADGSVHEYTIDSSTRVSKQEIPLDTIFDRAGAPRLVLITCGGQFNYETGHYLDNILVTAVPVAP